MSDVQDKASFIWSAAGKLRRPYEYQKKILSPAITRRMNCVPASTNDKVLKAHEKVKKAKSKNFERGIGVQLPLVCGASRDRWSVVPETFSRGQFFGTFGITMDSTGHRRYRPAAREPRRYLHSIRQKDYYVGNSNNHFRYRRNYFIDCPRLEYYF